MTAALTATIFCVALLAFANSLGNGFVWDDPIILQRQLSVFASLGDVLVPPGGIPQFSPDYYRPVTIASYLVDRAWGGDRPFAFHLSVVLAHSVTAALVFLVGRRLFGAAPEARWGAFAAAVLFAVHPIHTESVAWMAGRSDVLATLFALAAWLAHTGHPTRYRPLLVASLVLAALGSKEVGVAILPLVVLYDVLFRDGLAAVRRRPRPLWLLDYVGAAVAVVVYLGLRRAALSGLAGASAADTGIPPPDPADMLSLLGAYVGRLVWPFGLNAYIDQIPAGPIALVLSLATIGFGCLTAAIWRREGSPTLLYLFLWFLVGLAPAFAVPAKIPDAPMAERYLYLPSVAFCLLAGRAVQAVLCRVGTRSSLRLAVAGFVTLLAVLGCVMTWQRNRVWHDNLSLWTDTAAKSTVSGMPLRSLATTHQDLGHPDEARRLFTLALERRNTTQGKRLIYNNLGTLAFTAGEHGQARELYEQALSLSPTAPDVLFNLGLAIFYAGRQTPQSAAEAIPYYRQAESLSPHDGDIQAALGQAYLVGGDTPKARQYLERALQLGLPPEQASGVRQYLEILP